MTRTVLMNAGPWLPVPPAGYGGIENVVAALVPELRRRGIRVLLATVGQSTLPADERLTTFPGGQFEALQRPYNQVSGIAHAHLHAVVRALRDRPDIDLVHDHVEVAGLAVLAAAALAPGIPPVLHTLHWDLGKHASFYSGLDAGPRVRVNGVSAAQLDRAPAALRRHSVGHVHLATPLAVGADRRPRAEKAGHAVVMGRITPGKGQHLAARLAHECGFDLVLAGPVGPYRQPADLTAAGNAATGNPDVRYWQDQVRPLVDGVRVRWIGTVAGRERDSLVASARVALFTLQWEEPGGTAVVEALALGTPVVGLSRGCLPELVEHGRTGWLANSPDDLPALIQAAGRIDPGECREQAARRFTPAVMAERYADLYDQLISRSVPERMPL
ncbi:MAG TPA: glycosyltransferase [Streptosporangiaceae bacterium]|nr:glycosyltransferase [Streptosporangiaceae bacterium]